MLRVILSHVCTKVKTLKSFNDLRVFSFSESEVVPNERDKCIRRRSLDKVAISYRTNSER